MKSYLNYFLPGILTMLSLQQMAQQTSLFNTYVYDPFQLNIAYAGHACTEANVHYKTQWIGMKDAPKTFQVNAHTAIGKSNGLGLRVISQQSGLLNQTQATLGYAYRFKLSATADMHFGLGLGWTQNVLNTQKAIVMDAKDVSLSTSGKQKANGFDSEFGAMYVGQKLKAGVSVLHLYNSNPGFAGTTYKLLPQANFTASYIFNKGKKIEVEPWLVDRYTVNGNNTIEGLLNVHFSNVITVGAGYRSSYGMLGFVGAKVGNLKIAYSFDYGTSKNATATGSSHQIVLGFTMCKAAKTAIKTEEPLAVAVPVVPVDVKEEPPVKTEPVEEKKEEVAVKELPKEEPAVKEVPKETATSKTEEVKAIADINTLSEEVVFALENDKLDKKGLSKLDDIAKILKDNPGMKVSVVGHTCNKGEVGYNKALSERRAAYVKKQLIKRGVDSKNIEQVIGVGAKDELYENNDRASRRNNRTVRFIAL